MSQSWYKIWKRDLSFVVSKSKFVFPAPLALGWFLYLACISRDGFKTPASCIQWASYHPLVIPRKKKDVHVRAVSLQRPVDGEGKRRLEGEVETLFSSFSSRNQICDACCTRAREKMKRVRKRQNIGKYEGVESQVRLKNTLVPRIFVPSRCPRLAGLTRVFFCFVFRPFALCLQKRWRGPVRFYDPDVASRLSQNEVSFIFVLRAIRRLPAAKKRWLREKNHTRNTRVHFSYVQHVDREDNFFISLSTYWIR